MQVMSGALDVTTGENGVVSKVAEFIRHEDYNWLYFNNNVGVARVC
jgi:hypothetical protein